MGWIMSEEEIKIYDELEPEEKEVFDIFRMMKLDADYSNFKYHIFKLEGLLEDYEELKKLRENIQEKYFSVYDELLSEDLINDVLDLSDWALIREHEKETWDAESNLMAEIKNKLDEAVSMIDSGEAANMIIEEENNPDNFLD